MAGVRGRGADWRERPEESEKHSRPGASSRAAASSRCAGWLDRVVRGSRHRVRDLHRSRHSRPARHFPDRGLHAASACFEFSSFCPRGLCAGPQARRDLTIAVAPERSDRATARWAGDVLEIRLAAGPAARAARPFDAASARAGALGVARLDAIAQGVWAASPSSPVPRETPPAAGSGETDFTAFYVVHLPAGRRTRATRWRAFARAARSRERRARSRCCGSTPCPTTRCGGVLDLVLPAAARGATSTRPRRGTSRPATPRSWSACSTGACCPTTPTSAARVAGDAGRSGRTIAEAHGLAGVDDDGNGCVDDAHGWDFVDLARPPAYGRARTARIRTTTRTTSPATAPRSRE